MADDLTPPQSQASQTAVGENGCRVSKRVAYCASAVVVKKKQEGKKTPLFGRGRNGTKSGERYFPLSPPSSSELEGGLSQGRVLRATEKEDEKFASMAFAKKGGNLSPFHLIRNGSELCPVTLQPLPWIG